MSSETVCRARGPGRKTWRQSPSTKAKRIKKATSTGPRRTLLGTDSRQDCSPARAEVKASCWAHASGRTLRGRDEARKTRKFQCAFAVSAGTRPPRKESVLLRASVSLIVSVRPGCRELVPAARGERTLEIFSLQYAVFSFARFTLPCSYRRRPVAQTQPPRAGRRSGGARRPRRAARCRAPRSRRPRRDG